MTNGHHGKTVAELAELLGAPFSGDSSLTINRVSSIDTATKGSVTFLEKAKSGEPNQECTASCLIVSELDGSRASFGNVPSFIQVPDPKLAFALVAEVLHPSKRREPSVHASAVIAESANIDLTVFIGAHVAIGDETRIAGGTQIGPNVTIGDHVTIGADCVLHPGVSLYDNVTIGDRVVLHAGVCIGADGFGYVRGDVSYHKFPQVGTVLIEDDVELGAHTCVDRAALGQTRIGRGTKIDNMVHVGHNCDIGERVIIAAQTGISGSVTIEDDCVIGGQVGFGDHIRVQSGAVIGSKAGVLPGKIVRPGVWWGIPIQPLDEYKRLNAHLGHVPEMRQEIKELKSAIKELQTKTD